MQRRHGEWLLKAWEEVAQPEVEQKKGKASALSLIRCILHRHACIDYLRMPTCVLTQFQEVLPFFLRWLVKQ